MGRHNRQGRKGARGTRIAQINLWYQQGEAERMEVGNHFQGYGYQHADLGVQRANILPDKAEIPLLILVVKLRLTSDAGGGVTELDALTLAGELEEVRLIRLVICCGHGVLPPRLRTPPELWQWLPLPSSPRFS
jgi:hypothetical protein